MNKKLFIFAIFLGVTLGKIQADQNFNETREELIKKSQQEDQKLKDVYSRLKQEYNAEDLEIYEKRLHQELQTYMTRCLKDKNAASNVSGVANVANNLLQHLSTISDFDEAYTTSSMLFMQTWTNVVNNTIAKITTIDEQEGLQNAAEELKNLVMRLFVQPMNQRINEVEKQQMAKFEE